MTEHTASRHYRPPARALGRLVALQAGMARREPLLPLLGLFLPVFLLVVFGTVPAFESPAADPRFTVAGYYMPLWICLAITMIALFCLPQPFVRDRENRWLRRISTTPAPPSWLLGAQTVVNAVLALLAVAVLTLGSVAFFGMTAPAQPVGYLLAALLLTTAMFAVGLLVTAVAPTAGAVAALGMAVFHPLLFFSGLYVPREVLPAALRTVGDYVPLGAASEAMRDALVGTFPSATDLLVLVGWTVFCGLLAVRFFRWE